MLIADEVGLTFVYIYGSHPDFYKQPHPLPSGLQSLERYVYGFGFACHAPAARLVLSNSPSPKSFAQMFFAGLRKPPQFVGDVSVFFKICDTVQAEVSPYPKLRTEKPDGLTWRSHGVVVSLPDLVEALKGCKAIIEVRTHDFGSLHVQARFPFFEKYIIIPLIVPADKVVASKHDIRMLWHLLSKDVYRAELQRFLSRFWGSYDES